MKPKGEEKRMEIERRPECNKAENEDSINFAALSLSLSFGRYITSAGKLVKKVHERVSFLTQTRHSLSLGGIHVLR